MAMRNQRIFRNDKGHDLLTELESDSGPMSHLRTLFGEYLMDNLVYVLAVAGGIYFFWPVISSYFQTREAAVPRGEGRRRELLMEEEAEMTRMAIQRHRQLRNRLLGSEKAKTKRLLLKLLQDDSIDIGNDQDVDLSAQDVSEIRRVLSDVSIEDSGDSDAVQSWQFDANLTIETGPAWGHGQRDGTAPFEMIFTSAPIRISVWAGSYLDGIAVELGSGQVLSAGKTSGQPTSTLDLLDSSIRRVVCRSGEWLDGMNIIGSGGAELGWTGGTGGERQEFVGKCVGFRGSAPVNGPIDKFQVLHQ
jgi:hypothetical protein